MDVELPPSALTSWPDFNKKWNSSAGECSQGGVQWRLMRGTTVNGRSPTVRDLITSIEIRLIELTVVTKGHHKREPNQRLFFPCRPDFKKNHLSFVLCSFYRVRVSEEH